MVLVYFCYFVLFVLLLFLSCYNTNDAEDFLDRDSEFWSSLVARSSQSGFDYGKWSFLVFVKLCIYV